MKSINFPERYTLNQGQKKNDNSIDYKGYDKLLQKNIYIKLIPKESIFYEAIYNDFMMLFQFKHPNLVEVTDFGIIENVGLYYVMPMYHKIDPVQSIRSEGISFFLEVFFQLLCGLHFLHQRKKIHGNLNFNNVIIAKENDKLRVRIADYGISSYIKPKDILNITENNHYMAPELVTEHNSEFTRYSDYYSLGVILFKLLYNTLPTEEYFLVKDENLHTENLVKPLLDVDNGIIKIIKKLLNKNPYLRYKNSQQILSDLMPFLKKYNIKEKKESFIWKNVLKEIRKNKQIELKFYGEKIIQDILLKISKDFSNSKNINLSIISANNSLDIKLITDYIYYTYKHDNIPVVKISTIDNKKDLNDFIEYQIKNNLLPELINNEKYKVLLIENCNTFIRHQDDFFKLLKKNKRYKIIVGMDDTGCSLKKAVQGVKINYHKVKKLSVSEVKEYLKMYFGYGVLPATMEEYLLLQSNRDLKILNQYIDFYIEKDIILYRNLKWYFRMELFDKSIIPTQIVREISKKLDKFDKDIIDILSIITFWKKQFTVKELARILNITILKIDLRIGFLKKIQFVFQGKKFYSLYFPFLRDILKQYLPLSTKQNALKKILAYLNSQKTLSIIEKEILLNIYDNLKMYDEFLNTANLIINQTEEPEVKKRVFSLVYSNREILNTINPEKLLDLLIKYSWQLIDDNYSDKAFEIFQFLEKNIKNDNFGQLTNFYKILECYFLLNKEEYKKIINEIKNMKIDYFDVPIKIRILKILAKAYEKLNLLSEEKNTLSLIIKETQNLKNQDMFNIKTQTHIDLALIEEKNGNMTKAFEILSRINLKTKKNPILSILVYSHLAKLDIAMNKIANAEKHLRLAENIIKKTNSNINTKLFWEVKSLYLFLTGNYWQALLSNNKAFIQYKKENIFNFKLFAFKLIILMRMGFWEETKNLILEIMQTENLSEISRNNLKIILSYIGFVTGNNFVEVMDIESILSNGMILPGDYFYQHFLYLKNKKEENTLKKIEKKINEIMTKYEDRRAELKFLKINYYYATNQISKALSQLNKYLKFHSVLIENSEYFNFLAYKIKKEAFLQNITIDDYKKYLKKARIIVQKKTEFLPNDYFKTKYLEQKIISSIIYYYKLDIIGSMEVTTNSDFLDTIEEMTKIISKLTDKRKLFTEILKLAVRVSKTERGVIITFEEEEENFEFREIYYLNFSSESLKQIKDFVKEIANKVVKSKKPVFQTEINPNLPVDIKSVICIPLIIHNKVVGTVYLDTKNLLSFTPEEIKFLNIFAHLAGSALETSDVYSSLIHEKEELSRFINPPTHYNIGIIGNSPAIKEVYKKIEKISKTNVNVLIQGESGTGKELVAKAIYKLSLKNDKPFIPVDCGSLSNDIIESELFGHIKGAFTGAISDKKGLFEEANGGTIFLDEISNISLSMQAKLLRVLQEGEIKRIGENTVRKVDVRIIAASNIDLKELVKTGNFREDLYFRLSTFPIFIPPLRERKEDIKILAVYFLNYFSKIHKKNIIGLTEEAYKIIYNYSWPGNVRELKNELERAVIMYNGNKKLIGASYFEQLISDDFYHDSEKIPIGNFNELVNEFKIKVIENAYQKSGKNWTKTAKMLGISRQNLNQIYKRLKHQS